MIDLLPDWLAHRAAVLPAHPAVITPAGDIVSYRELDERARALASALAGRGVAPGDRVAILATNSMELVEAVHAVPRLGAILAPLNTRLTPGELAFQLRDAGAEVLLCHEPTAAQAAAAAMSAGLPTPLTLPLPPASGSVPALADAHAPGDVHSIIYTSGTTGQPKGALLTFGNFWASAAASAYNLGVDPADRWLACMPLFHVGGLSILLRSAIYGTTVVLHEGFDERAVNRSIREDRVTLISVVATMLQRMLDADDLPYPDTLRVVLAGGGPVPGPPLERALARGLPVVQTYGLTEAASQVATLSPAHAVSHLGSAGQPLVTTRLRIDAPTGEPGEILVSGPTLTPGYWQNPEATARAIRDGWLHTGDVGRLDPNGFLYVMDRRDDLIVTGGENVYPAEVEAALLAHPQVRGAAVVGLPDDRWGQLVTAAYLANGDIDAEALADYLRERLAGYKVPRRFERVSELPMTANGKIQRRRVREMLGG